MKPHVCKGNIDFIYMFANPMNPEKYFPLIIEIFDKTFFLTRFLMNVLTIQAIFQYYMYTFELRFRNDHFLNFLQPRKIDIGHVLK